MLQFEHILCFGAQKNRLIEMVPLSSHNMFWFRNKKNIFWYALLTKGLITVNILASIVQYFHMGLNCIEIDVSQLYPECHKNHLVLYN